MVIDKGNLKCFIILAFILACSATFGMFYYNSIGVNNTDTEPVYIGEPPEFLPIINPDTDGNIFVHWYQLENAISYDLYRNVDGWGFTLIAQVLHRLDLGIFKGYFRDQNLVNGQYGYKIKAIYINGESDFSLVKFIDVLIIPW